MGPMLMFTWGVYCLYKTWASQLVFIYVQAWPPSLPSITNACLNLAFVVIKLHVKGKQSQQLDE